MVVETEVDLARWTRVIICDQTLGRKTEQAASLGAGELLGKVLSGSLGCFYCISVLTLPWLGCKTGLGLVILGKALLPPEL